MKYRALLIATFAAATLSCSGFAQALTNAESGSLMRRDGGHTGAKVPSRVRHAPRFPGPIVSVIRPHHYRYYRHD
jgi:hypothetical protein